MTTKDAFTPEEWTTVLQAPPAAGMLVVVAAHGGMFRETVAMSKAYVEARSQHGESELLDEIVAAKPSMDRKRFHSPEEMRGEVLGRLESAVAVLQSKATPEEVDGYRRFVLALADRVAAAHREDGVEVSPQESAAIGEIRTALGATSPA